MCVSVCLELFILYWSINKQCCNSSRWTVEGLSHTYTCIHSPLKPLSSRLPHNTEHSSLCYTVGPCWLSILNIAVYTCLSQTPWLSLSPHPYPWQPWVNFLSLWVCFCFVRLFVSFSLDSTYKGCHTIFLLYLTYFTQTFVLFQAANFVVLCYSNGRKLIYSSI